MLHKSNIPQVGINKGHKTTTEKKLYYVPQVIEHADEQWAGGQDEEDWYRDHDQDHVALRDAQLHLRAPRVADVERVERADDDQDEEEEDVATDAEPHDGLDPGIFEDFFDLGRELIGRKHQGH